MLSHSACIAHFTQSQDGSLNKVVRVGRSLRLCQDIRYTGTFQDSTHGAACNHSGTFGSGEDQNSGSTKFCSLLMRYSTFQNGDLYQVLLGCFYAFGNGGSYFAGFAETATNDTLTITHYNNGSEREGASTLGNFHYAIDSNQSIL